MADLGRQLEIQNQINKVLANRKVLLDQNAAALSKQARIAKELCKAMECEGLDTLEQNLNDINRAAKKAGEGAKQAGAGMENMNEAARDSAEDMKGLNKELIAVGAGIGFLKGLQKGFKNMGNIIKGAFKMIKNITVAFFNMGKAILSLPFKIFAGLIEMSQEIGSPAFLQALEEVRKTFGDIATGSGAALRNSVKEMRQEFGGLSKATALTGLSFGRVFGYGPEGNAAALKFNAEMATELGGSYHGMMKEIKGSYSELAYYRKGLGLTSKAQGLMMKQAYKSGEDIMGFQKKFAQVAIHIGNTTEYSAKEIGSTMGAMFEDVKNFGSFSHKQLGAMTLATKKLGMETKDLVGIMDGFDSFSTASKNVATLRRQFGLNLDVMKMHAEEDPVKRIQMIQKEALRTGFDVNKLGRRQLKALAGSVNMGEAEVKNMLQKKNLTMDYDKIQKKVGKGDKKKLSTAQVMLKLSKQIERIFGQGSKKYTGFFDALGQGFTRGVKRSMPFRNAMRNIRKSLRLTDFAGRDLGRNFVKYFPGVKKLLGAIEDFFNPAKLLPALTAINREFKRFFISLRGGDIEGSMDTLGKNSLGILKQYFGGKGEAVEMFKESFLTIGKIIGNIKLILMRKAVEAASETINKFTDGLTVFLDYGLGPQFGKAGSKAGEMFGDNFGKVIGAVKFNLLPALERAIPQLWKGVQRMMKAIKGFIFDNKEVIFEAIKDTMMFVFKMKFEFLKFAGKTLMEEPIAGMVMMAPLLGPAIGGALMMAFKTGIGSMAFPYLASRVSKTFASHLARSKTAGPLAKSFGSMGRRAATGKGGFLSSMGKKLASGMGKGSKFAGVLSKGSRILGKFGPWAALGVAAVSGIMKGMDTKGPASRKWKEGGKAFAGSLLSGVTFGLIDGQGAMEAVFGKYFSDPIQQAQYDLTRSSDKTAQAIGLHSQKALESASNYQNYVDYMKTAASEAAKLGDGGVLGEADLEFALLEQTLQARQTLEMKSLEASVKANTKHADGIVSLRDEQMHQTWGAQSHNAKTMAYLKSQQFEEDKQRMSKQARDILAIQLRTGDVMDEQSGMIIRRAGNVNHSLNPIIHELEKDMERDKNRMANIESGRAMFNDMLAAGGTKRVNDYLAYASREIDVLEKSGNENNIALAKTRRAAMEELAKTLTSHNIEVTESIAGANYKAEEEAFIKKYAGEHAKMVNGIQISEDVLRAQARMQVDRAVASGRMDLLISQEGGAAITKAMKAGGVGSRLTDGQTEQLKELEAAATTVERIKAVANIPKELKKLQKTMGGISNEQIAADVDTLVITAVGLGKAVNKAVKKHMSDDTVYKALDTTLVAQMESVKSIRMVLNEVIGKPIPGAAKQQGRIDLIEYGVTSIGTMLGFISESPFNPTAVNAIIGDLTTILPNITNGIFGAFPDNMKDKVAKARTAVSEVERMIDHFSTGKGATKIKVAADLAKAINKRGSLKISHSGLKVNAHFTLNVNAKDFVGEMIQVKNITGAPGRQLATKKADGK